ncbi:MAG: flavodoxin family protein [Candidatus Omnitrophica bacterium]|nr:flavodoxin family protein [Candidatus Omnitrophota bacterium]MDD5513261.1 flavodoxin family protein [Candidatus Omnitrophota bacterium]
MKTLIIYHSEGHKNTEKVARAIQEVLGADLVEESKVDFNSLQQYDLIGFGAGIYFSAHHAALNDFAGKLPELNKNVFIFSTSGIGTVRFHKALKKILEQKKCWIVGEFSCKAFDTFGPLKLVGGINKGRPNEADLENARKFARSLQVGGRHA